MITTRQRAALRAMAQKIDPVVLIGKGGISDAVIDSVKYVIEKRELIKIKLLQNSGIDTKECSEILCKTLVAEPVQKIGNVLVIYKRSDKDDVKHIEF